MSSSNVTVSIKRGATSATATNLCKGSTAGDSVFVKTSFDGQLIIPPIIFKDHFPIASTGAYECEFS